MPERFVQILMQTSHLSSLDTHTHTPTHTHRTEALLGWPFSLHTRCCPIKTGTDECWLFALIADFTLRWAFFFPFSVLIQWIYLHERQEKKNVPKTSACFFFFLYQHSHCFTLRLTLTHGSCSVKKKTKKPPQQTVICWTAAPPDQRGVRSLV